jgi:predicted dehydrogenase
MRLAGDAGEPPLRLAVIGCGRVFERYHRRAIAASRDVAVVAACDVDPGRRAWAGTALPGVPCYDSMPDMLRAHEADAALITAPPSVHAPAAAAALRAGLSVLIEKPMALSLTEAHNLQQLQRETGRVLRVGFNRRYRSDYLRLRSRTNEVQQIEFRFIADLRQWNPAVEATAQFVLQDAGSHALDLVAWLAARRIQRVSARFDTAGPDRAVRIKAELTGGVAAECTVGHGPRYEEHLVIGGSAGRRRYAASSLASRAVLAWCKLAGRPTPTSLSFRAQLAGFLAACRGRPDSIGAGADHGVAAVAAVEAALRSVNAAGAWQEVHS